MIPGTDQPDLISARPPSASVQSDQRKKLYNMKEKAEWILILKKIIGQD